VFEVCRQVLRDGHDAEDAFQATFLVLARKAATVRRHESLAAWLHRVALNIARTAKASAAQRRDHERQAGLMPRTTPVDDVAPRDWEPLLHEEVDRLPEKYRVPVVLCYLEGKTHDEAARQLGWPLGTVKGRLARARDLLRTRLVRRGLTLSAGALAAALAQSAAQGHIPATLLGSTLRASVSFASGAAIPAGAASAQAVTLAKGALKTMTATKLVPVLVLLLALGAAGFAATLGHGLGRETPPAAPLVTEGETRPASGTGGEAPHAEPQAKHELPPKAAEAEAVNGLKLTLRLDKTETRLRADGSDIEPVNLRFTYANVSDRPIKLDFTVAAALCGTRLEVTGPDVRKFANQRPANQPDKLIPEDFRVLKPGEEWSIELSFPLWIFFWDLFMVKQPGDYRINTVYALDKETDSPLAKGSWTGTVTSNEVVLKVLPADDFGPEVKGLRAKVSLVAMQKHPVQKFVASDRIVVSYVVKNVSKEEQTLWHCGFWPNHQIIVKDAGGKEPPLTAFGQQCRKAFAPGGERGKNVAVKVPAGGEDAAYEQYDLTKLYDLSKPGRYTVQYVYEEKQGGWEGRLPSNAAAFEMVAANDKDEKSGQTEYQDKLQGRWLAVELDGAGQNVRKDVGEFPVLVKGDRITLDQASGKKEFRFLIERNQSNGNTQIDLIPAGDNDQGPTWRGICYLASDGDRFDLCFYKNDPQKRPPEFPAKADVGLWAIRCLRRADSPPVRVEGLEFVARVPERIPFPPHGGLINVDLSLRVTNVSDKPLGVSVDDVIRPWVFNAADGKKLECSIGRDGSPRPQTPFTLAPGESWTWQPQATLGWAKDGKGLVLSGPDGRGVPGFWSFRLPKEGKYRLAIEYANTTAKQGDVPLWVGKATTKEVEFEIVAPERQVSGPEVLPIEQLIADLNSADGATRVAATNEILRRGKNVLPDLQRAGARQLGRGDTAARRLHMVYSLLEGLPDPTPRSGYRTDRLNIYVENACTKAEVAGWGERFGFTPFDICYSSQPPHCGVLLGEGKTLPDVIHALMSEPKVITVHLGYWDK
jgi:RNA polymerase sigma factor (sigma-70 family)